MNIHSVCGKIKRQGGEQMLQNVPGKDLALVYKALDMSVYFLLSWNNLRNKCGVYINYEGDRKSSAEMFAGPE